uniref:Uncharacterized protein n=1 Tax=Oryza meridionalis TaxID=40149 RepID=A0A0E0CWW0_9ORYZ
MRWSIRQLTLRILPFQAPLEADSVAFHMADIVVAIKDNGSGRRLPSQGARKQMGIDVRAKLPFFAWPCTAGEGMAAEQLEYCFNGSFSLEIAVSSIFSYAFFFTVLIWWNQNQIVWWLNF